MEDGHYIGGMLGWFSPSLRFVDWACARNLQPSFGASWLARKCESSIRERRISLVTRIDRRRAAFLACAFVAAVMMHLDLMNRWLRAPIC